MDELLKKIRNDLRRSMNGVASKSMRDKGLNYKMNFGVDTLRLKDLSNNYPKDAELAELLWKQETRELKILATMLYPTDMFDSIKANIWLTEIPTSEIREQLCINLLQNLRYASDLINEWNNSDNETHRSTAYWLLARLILSKKYNEKNIETANIINNASQDLFSDSYFVRSAAVNVLKLLGRNNQSVANIILNDLSLLKQSENKRYVEIYESLVFEFENSNNLSIK